MFSSVKTPTHQSVTLQISSTHISVHRNVFATSTAFTYMQLCVENRNVMQLSEVWKWNGGSVSILSTRPNYHAMYHIAVDESKIISCLEMFDWMIKFYFYAYVWRSLGCLLAVILLALERCNKSYVQPNLHIGEIYSNLPHDKYWNSSYRYIGLPLTHHMHSSHVNWENLCNDYYYLSYESNSNLSIWRWKKYECLENELNGRNTANQCRWLRGRRT